jgi:hypothetical protein
MGPFFVQYIVYNLTYPRNIHLSQNSSHNFPHCTECASLSIAEHLPVITGSKPLAKPSRTGFDQLSSNHKPEPAKAAVLASWLAASRAAATLYIAPAFQRYSTFSVLMGRYSRLVNSPLGSWAAKKWKVIMLGRQ